MNIEILWILTALIGLIIGSFLNVVIFRYPKMLAQQWQKECMEYLKQPRIYQPRRYNLNTPRSHCTQCHQTLKPWHMIPIVSYLFLQGRCAFCKKTLSALDPIIELLAAIVAVIMIYKFGFSWPGLLAVFFSWGLIVLSFIDIQKQLLPDNITLSLLWLGLFANASSFYTSPTEAIFGVLIGYLMLWGINRLFMMIRHKTGMGHGDFKMLAMLGAWLGASMLLNVILISTPIALLISLVLTLNKKTSMKRPIAFGPYLALGGWLNFIFGSNITHWITRILT